MVINVDRKDDMLVQKIVKPDGTLVRYQCGVPGDASRIKPAVTLTEARQAIGKGAVR